MALEAFAKAHALLQPIQGLHAELARLPQSACFHLVSQGSKLSTLLADE